MHQEHCRLRVLPPPLINCTQLTNFLQKKWILKRENIQGVSKEDINFDLKFILAFTLYLAQQCSTSTTTYAMCSLRMSVINVLQNSIYFVKIHNKYRSFHICQKFISEKMKQQLPRSSVVWYTCIILLLRSTSPGHLFL